MEEKQPWVGCFLSHVLVTYIEGTFKGKRGIDYPSLFRGIEGFEIPSDPMLFLKDVSNWIPLRVLRELLSQCERISGEKDVAYQAARAYFDPHKRQFPSLFEIIARVLNDVRSLLICGDLWASVQTNYLKFQSFERRGDRPGLYLLSRFEEIAKPGVGTISFLRGMCEGFILLSSSVVDVQCIEELSQLQVEDIVREFPDFTTIREEDRLFIRHRSSQESVVEAIKIPLKHESIPLSEEFMGKVPDAAVVPPHDGRLDVVTPLEEVDPSKRTYAPPAYKIVKAGVLSHDTLCYSFKKDQFYDAPYSRFRVAWKETPSQPREVSAEHVRREISRLLFEHLERIRQAQMRMVQYNIDKERLTLENIRLRREIEREYSFAGILGESQEIQDVIGLIRSIAETDVTVLIQGETGTGKELIARAIHYNGPRAAKRFVALNCGSFAETLLESELFGHERGAFTGAIAQKKGIFEVANGGTLFLDEIGEIPPSTQVKILRVLQEGEFQRVGGTDPIHVDVRTVAATNQSLEDLIKAGRFRQDLYYRLNVVPVHVPPLRERAGDIPLLVSHFIEKRNPRLNKRIAGMSPQAMALLMAHDWPGNVRELENVVQRMMVVSKSEILDVQDIPAEIRGVEEERWGKAKDLKDIARETTGLAEKSVILDALTQTGWNVTRAARSLGVSRATLQTKMKLYGLRSPTK